MDLAFKDIRQQLGKFAATVLGVGMLLGIVLVMNSIYRGNIMDGKWLIENTRTDLWVVEQDTGGPFNEQSRMSKDAWKSLSAMQEVNAADPFISYSVEREIGDKRRHFTIIGFDVFGTLGGPGRLVKGRTIEQAHYEIVADAKLGLELGDNLWLGRHNYTVVGLTRNAKDSRGNPLVYMSLPDAQEVLYQQDNRALELNRAGSRQKLQELGLSERLIQKVLPMFTGGAGASKSTVNAILVSLKEGVDKQEVVGTIEDWLHFDAYTTEQEKQLVLKGRLKKMSATLNLFRSLLIMVSIVIVSLMVYILTMQKIREIATLKLLGASSWTIVRLVLEQSLLLTVGGFMLAYFLASKVVIGMNLFPRNLVLLPGDTAFTFLIVFAGGMLASLGGVWIALRTSPSRALG